MGRNHVILLLFLLLITQVYFILYLKKTSDKLIDKVAILEEKQITLQHGLRTIISEYHEMIYNYVHMLESKTFHKDGTPDHHIYWQWYHTISILGVLNTIEDPTIFPNNSAWHSLRKFFDEKNPEWFNPDSETNSQMPKAYEHIINAFELILRDPNTNTQLKNENPNEVDHKEAVKQSNKGLH